MERFQLLALSDNYIYLLADFESGEAAVVDPAEARPVLEVLARHALRLRYVLNTHHHFDHVGANRELRQETGCDVVGFRGDAHRITAISKMVEEGNEIELGDFRLTVLEVPGHTRGHIAYFLPEKAWLFCGDTLFALGCGRLFEGTPQQMWRSLCKLRQLPPATEVCCAHEYTLKNARFALTVDPDNPKLRARYEEIKRRAAEGKPNVPSRLAEELETNPFLRADDPALQRQLGMEGWDPVEVFAELRRRRDMF